MLVCPEALREECQSSSLCSRQLLAHRVFRLHAVRWVMRLRSWGYNNPRQMEAGDILTLGEWKPTVSLSTLVTLSTDTLVLTAQRIAYVLCVNELPRIRAMGFFFSVCGNEHVSKRTAIHPLRRNGTVLHMLAIRFSDVSFSLAVILPAIAFEMTRRTAQQCLLAILFSCEFEPKGTSYLKRTARHLRCTTTVHWLMKLPRRNIQGSKLTSGESAMSKLNGAMLSREGKEARRVSLARMASGEYSTIYISH